MSDRTLARGENSPLSSTTVSVTATGSAIDLVAFVLTADRRVRTDDDFIFFNNPHGAGGAVSLVGPAALRLDLDRLPSEIERVAVGVSVDAPATLGAIPLTTVVADGPATLSAPSAGLTIERAAILVEVYRRGGQWKVRNESAGWEEGFAALVREHGVVVDDAPAVPPTPAVSPTPVVPPAPPAHTTPTPAHSPEPTIRMVKGEEKLSLDKRHKLNLRKEQVHKVLLTKGAAGATARVILVIDKTMSMRKLYKQKTVHRVVERMIPVATQLDSDGNLEAYLYGSGYAGLPDVTVADSEAWMQTYIHLSGTHGPPLGPEINYDKQIGGVNEELPIMRALLDTITDRQPVFVLFFTDGGFHSKVPQIKRLIHDASNQPVFWQFIGLGRNRFGILTDLDTLTGRTVDNAGFFAIDDIDKLSDGDLYRQLLSEFPDWLREATRLGIVDARYAGNT